MKLLDKLLGRKTLVEVPHASVLREHIAATMSMFLSVRGADSLLRAETAVVWRKDYEVFLTHNPFEVDDRENVVAFVHLREMDSYDEFKKMQSDEALRHGPLAVMALNYLADQLARKLLVLAEASG